MNQRTAGLRRTQPPRQASSVGRPTSSSASPVLALQRSAGNRAVTRLLTDGAGWRTAEPKSVVVQRDLGHLFETFGEVVSAGVKAVTSAPLLAVELAAQGLVPASVRLLIRNGEADENELTNTAFFLVHPELPWGVKLRPDEIAEHRQLAEEWALLRDRVVRPELARFRAARPGTGVTEGPVTPGRSAAAPRTDSEAFLDANRELLSALPASEDELLSMLDVVLRSGSATRLEYTAYDYQRPSPLPLVHQLFVARHPGVDPLTSLTDAKGKRTAALISSWEAVASKAGGWAAVGVTAAHWAEIKAIRDDLLYPFMRVVLPRIEAPGPLPVDADAGERIAHQAHAYLGVRYVLGGSYRGTDPWAADPAQEEGAGLDCSALVRGVLSDTGLTWTRGKSAGGSNVPQLRDSPDMVAVEGSPQTGDLLFRDKHVGIFIGDGLLIHAPHTGKVVSKEAYDASKWETIRRYQLAARP